MQDIIKLSDSEKLDVAKAQAAAIRASLPKEIRMGSFSLNSKLPWKAMSFRELLLHRFSDFIEATILLYETDHLLPAFVLTRAVIETSASMYFLLVKVREFQKYRDIHAFDDFLMKGLMGSKIDFDLKPYNILTAVDHLDKRYNGVREAYDRLSEFTHPNYSGVTGSYSSSKPKEFVTYLGRDVIEVPKDFGLIPFLVSLAVFVDDYNAVGHAVAAINDSFENHK
jgi:hypothetical protein